eukprot:2863847-Amphidinium_carterae.2
MDSEMLSITCCCEHGRSTSFPGAWQDYGCTIGQLGGLELAARSCGRIRVCHQVMDRGMGRLFRAGLAGYWRCQMQENAAPTHTMP